MTLLTRWNPLRTATRFEPPTAFDDLFRNFALRTGFGDTEPAPEMKLDVSEEDKAFIVRAEIPGVTKDDIEISVEGPQVSVSAEVRRDKSWQDKEKTLYTESGTTARSTARSRCRRKSIRASATRITRAACSR